MLILAPVDRAAEIPDLVAAGADEGQVRELVRDAMRLERR